MIIFTVVNFFDWLDEELDKRHWVRADLAKHAKISESGLSMAYSGKRQIGQRMLTAIAEALRVPSEAVFRAAGLLPPEPGDIDEQADAIAYRTSRMTQAQKRAVLAFINSLEQGDIEPAAEPPANGKLSPQPK